MDYTKMLDSLTFKNVLFLSLGLTSTYLLYKTVQLYLKKRKYSHIPGPPTEGLFGFFVGNIPEIQRTIKKGKPMQDLFVEWHETYGDVFKFQMFDRIIVVTSDKNTIKYVLITKVYPREKYRNSSLSDPLGIRFLGRGLITVRLFNKKEMDFDRWKHRRAMLNPGFHRKVLVTCVDHFNQIVNTLSEKLRSKADNKTEVSLLNELNRATLDAIALIAFGMNTDAVLVEDSIINEYMTSIMTMIFRGFINPYIKYMPSKQKEIKEFRHMIEYIRDLGRNRILERINAYKNNEHMADDILSSILSDKKEAERDIELMVDDFVTMFGAGQETTANTLSFSFLEIGRNPEIVKKAREEIDRVLGERTELTFQDVNELKYCSAIFKEALRLYPPAPVLARMIPEEIDIHGLLIPKGTSHWFSTYMNGRLEQFFKNPLEFKPERFLKSANSDESNIESYIYHPFGLGPRICIGQNFAQLQGVIVLAKLLQKFDFRLDPTQSFSIVQGITLKPKDGTRVFVSLRK